MLTEQKMLFVDEFIRLRCKNQTQAAINAGYSEKTATQKASMLMKDREVLEYLKKRKQEVFDEIKGEIALSASDALNTVCEVMTNPDAKDADRLKAAFDILDRAGFKPDDKQKIQVEALSQVSKLDDLIRQMKSDD